MILYILANINMQYSMFHLKALQSSTLWFSTCKRHMRHIVLGAIWAPLPPQLNTSAIAGWRREGDQQENFALSFNHSHSADRHAPMYKCQYLMLLLVYDFAFYAFYMLMLFVCVFQVVVVLQQVFALIQTVLSKWLNDSQVVEVSFQHMRPHTVRTLLMSEIGQLKRMLHFSETDIMFFLRRCVPSLRSLWRLCSMTLLPWCLS